MPKSYSQFGEDIEILGFFPQGYAGFYLDVGANDGVRDSNSLLLEEQGWKGLLVEANPKLAEKAAKVRPRSIVINAAATSVDGAEVTFSVASLEGSNLDGLSSLSLDAETRTKVQNLGGGIEEITVTARKLDSILEAHLPPGVGLDFVSLDIEGAEYEALGGLNLQRFRPRLVVIEDNSRGAEDAVPRLMQKNGYLRVHRTGWNDWYVPKTDAGQFLWRRIILRLRLMKWSIERIFRK